MVRLHAFDSDEVSSQVQSHICPSQKPVGIYVYSRKIFAFLTSMTSNYLLFLSHKSTKC